MMADARKTAIWYCGLVRLYSPTTIDELVSLGFARKTLQNVCRQLDDAGAIEWRRGSIADSGSLTYKCLPEELGSWEDIDDYRPQRRNRGGSDDAIQTAIPEEPVRASAEDVLAFLDSLDLSEEPELLVLRSQWRGIIAGIIRERSLPGCPICGRTMRYNEGMEPRNTGMLCDDCNLFLPGSFETCVEAAKRLRDAYVKEAVE